MLNSNIIVPNIDALTYKEWLSIRKSGLGGSDIAAALGLSPWKSALELWQEKVSGQSQPQQENEAMIWGRIMEPIIAREFVKRSGLQVNPFRSMLQSPQYPWMLANLDGLIEDPHRGVGVFEVKTASAYKQAEWAEGRCPDAYMLQLAHYLAVTGLDFAVVCVLIGGNKLQWSTVERDDELIASVIDLERHFWQYVLTNTPPPVDSSSACADMLKNKYPSSTNQTPLILPIEADSWVKDYLAAKVEEDAAADKIRLSENRLKEILQDFERGTTPSGHQITWKTVTSSRVDTARLKKEEPALLERYTTTTATSRRFSISEAK